MASAKQMVAKVSEHLGVPLESVTVIDRFLAEAGLRTRALRGRGQTAMTYRDAANLIIATALGAAPKDAVTHVKSYGALPSRRVKEDASIAEDALGVTFGEALANMIEAVAESREEFSAPDDAPGAMSARVLLYGPEPQAEIILVKGARPSTFEFGSMPRRVGDLRRTVEFSQVTLGHVGEAIAEEEA